MDDPGKSSTGIMENKLRHKFTIPKIKRDPEKVCILRCRPESREYNDIMDTLDKGRLNMNCELRSSWEFSEIRLVMNKDLEQTFFEKRNEMKELGRNIRELEEKYCFLIVPYESAATISNYGISVGNMAKKTLGRPHMGAYLFRHIDVALTFSHQKNLTSSVVVVFKVLFGKVRKVHSVSPKKTPLDPTPNFDSHVSKQPPIWNDPFDEQVKNSLIYVYEYDSSLKPVKSPRQCLPIALVKATFLIQKTALPPARYPSQPVSSGSDALANCTVAQRIGKGKDATVIFHSVRTPMIKPSLREISQNSSLQNEAQTTPVVNRHQKCESHVPTPVFQNQISLPNYCMPYNHFCMSLESLITSSMVISSKSIKDPRLSKRCEQEVVKFTGQCLLGQQNQKEFAFESEASSLKEKDPSKENLGTLETNTSLYLSFEEARFSDENYMMKKQESKKIDEKEHTKAADQYITEQQRQTYCIFDNEVSNIEDDDPSEERESWENNVIKTSPYLSFEEARFSDDSCKAKEQVMKTEEQQSLVFTFTENVEDAEGKSSQYLSMVENSIHSNKLSEFGMSQTLHDIRLDVTNDDEPVKLSSSLEKTSTTPRSVNQSKRPAKINNKSHLLQNKGQLLSSGINRGQCEDSDSMSAKQNQRDTLPKVVLNPSDNNEPLSSEKLTEFESAEVTTQPETLQNHLNSSLEKTFASPRIVNQSKYPAKANYKRHLLQNKEQLISSEINRGKSEDSDSMSPKQNQIDTLPKVVLNFNNNNEPLSSEKLAEFESTEVTTQPGTLLNHLNSSLEKTFAQPRSVNESKYPAKTNSKSHLLAHKGQLLSSGIDMGHSEDSDGISPNQNQRDTLPKVVLNASNSKCQQQFLSSEKLTECEITAVTTQPGTLQNQLNLSLEKTFAPPIIVSHCKHPAKTNYKSHLLTNKDQLLSSGINMGQPENSDCISPKQKERDTLPKVVLNANNSNEPLSLEKLTEYKSGKVNTIPETLQNHQNSFYDGDKIVCSNGNRSKLVRTKAHHINKSIFQTVKTSLASGKEHLEKAVQSETCISYLDLKAKKTVLHTSPHKHPSTSPCHLNTKSLKAAEKCLMKKSPEKKAQEQHLHKKEKFEPIKTIPGSSPKKMKEGNKQNTTSNLPNDFDMDLVAKNLHFNDSVGKSQTEITRTHNSFVGQNTCQDIQCDLQCMIELASRIDWIGIFGIQKEKAEEMAELRKPSRKLREPSGLRIFPDMEITIRNSHYVCVEQDVNSFVEVHSSMSVKEKINSSFEKEFPSDPQKASSVSEIATEKTSPMSQDCKAPVDSRPELHCVRMTESLNSDRKLSTQNQKSEAIDENNLTCVKTKGSSSRSKIKKKKLSSTRRQSVVIKKSFRRMNKFSQSEKNIKVVLGLLSGEIPLCKSKRISKRLDRAVLHLRKAHKRVQKSLQLVAKSGSSCNIRETFQATGNCDQENHDIKNHYDFKIEKQNGKRIDTKGKQDENVKVQCRSKQMSKLPSSLKVAVPVKHQKKFSPAVRKCLNVTTQVVNGISAKDSFLAATSGNSPLSSKILLSPPYRNRLGIATESSASSPSVSKSDIEDAVPLISLPKSTTEKKEVPTEICQKGKKDRKRKICTKKMLLQAKKYHLSHANIKTSKKKDSACEKIQHKRRKVKQTTFTTAKNTEVPRLLGKLSKILQNASETHDLKSLQDCRSLCKQMLPIFIKSFERKQKCSWKDVIVDRKLLFSHHLKTSFRSTLKPQAVEYFLELQMMIETTQFIENRIRFIEGRPTFRSLLWYDGSLYRELLAGEAGFQQQSHFYTAFQEKLNDSAVTTLESLCSRLSEFLQEIDDKNSSYYVYLKYKRELKECEDVLKRDSDYSAFSLSIPFTCGAHLGNTVDDLMTLQKSTLEIISRFIQFPKVEPGKKEHALCLLEMISAKIDFLRTSVSLSMNLSLFGIQHLLFDAAKMMVLKEKKALGRNKKIILTKEIIGQINSNALSKLYEVFCVPGKEAWVAYDIDELWNENFKSLNNLGLTSHNNKFLVGKIIDQARHAETCLLQQMILECQKHLDSQIISFQILQECDVEKSLIKDSNVKELTQRKDSLTTLIKTEAVESYIELAMTYETLHFLNCVMASQKKQDTKRGLLWYDTSLLSDLVQIQKRLASFLTGNMIPSAIDTMESRIVDIKSELEVISNCSDSVNYTYAFQIMTRELSELSELKKLVLKPCSTIHGYIHFSPGVVSLHYGSLSTELDYNYSQFSDFLGNLMSSPKKDLGKMAHTMKIMKTIELAKALNDKNNNSPFDLITCQILQNRMKSDCLVNKTPNGGKAKVLNDQSPRKRKSSSPEAVSPKKVKVKNTCEMSPGKEKTVSHSSKKPSFDLNVSQRKKIQSPVKKHCKKSSIENDIKAFVSTSPKCREKDTVTSIGISKSIQSTKSCSPLQHSLSPNEVNKSCSPSPNPSPRSSVSTDNICSPNSKNDQNRTNRKYSESLTVSRSDHKISNEPSDIPDGKINKEASTETEAILAKLSERKDVTALGEQRECQENPASEEKQDTNPPNGQLTPAKRDGWNNQPVTSVNSEYQQYPGSYNPWQYSSYLWYHNNALSQAFPSVPYDAQNANRYNQTSTFPTLASYATNQPYSNFMGQIQPQGYPASGPFGATVPYNYSAPSSTSNQNGVPNPYSYTSNVMAGWSWNSWQ